MDIKAYISSGVLELYVSGALDKTEAKEVQKYAEKYPEILQEIEAIEAAIMAYMSSFVGEKRKLPILNKTAIARPLEPLAAVKEEQEAVVRKINWRIWAVAASVLLFTSIVLNLYFFQQWQASDSLIAALTEENTQLALKNGQITKDYESASRVMLDPAFLRISMKNASDTLPESYLTNVYWNPNTEDVRVLIDKLPDIDETISQYQLWAIKKEGVPISVGVFDMKNGLQEQDIKIGGDIIAFAVTEEPKGGSVVPTLEKMRVVGNVPKNNS